MDEQFMFRCLQLASKGVGQVAPNPLVGAVLVHQDTIIGEGWHQQFGGAHAEVNCINSVSENNKKFISESTMYVSLEPCAHFGKTPPCADLLINSGIKKVVIACVDTFSQVAGRGIEKMRNAGIEVVVGVLEDEARALNKRFFTFHEKKRPYVILKWAQSQDGFIAPVNGRKVMLSNDLVQRYVHKMRSEEAAILVGYNTALQDNPMLNNRFYGAHQPVRVVIDEQNNLHNSLHLKSDGQATVIFNYKINEQIGNLRYIKLNDQKPLVEQVLENLYNLEINSLIVEGGTKTLQKFIDNHFWDEAIAIATPVILKEGVLAPRLFNNSLVEKYNLSDNVIEKYVIDNL